ncbi:MAG: DUF4870 domain-containing protein [Sedimentisphaerales bacterium]|nr:DUF4870 domain-containing protein [Sedimentisphaerales bacterium]
MTEMNENSQAPDNAGAEQTNQPVSEPQPVDAGQSAVGKDDKNMAMLCHILAIFTGFLGPLIIWLIKKDDSPFVDRHGKEALNFQLTILIAWVASGLLSFVCIGFILMPVVAVVDLVFCILAAVKTSRGEEYRYPVCIRFVK